MTISGVGTRSSLSIQGLIDLRAQLTDLQRQLGTGKKADTYAGLGIDRTLTVGLRSQVSAMESFGQTIGLVNMRLDLTQTTLDGIEDVARAAKLEALNSPFVLNTSNQTQDQASARNHLDEILGMLGTKAGDRFMFSGTATDKAPVETTDHILNGEGARAGFLQVLSERRQADLGAGLNGRLVVTAPTGTSVQVAEDVAGSPFGFKLASISSNITGAALIGPAGVPPAMSIDLTTLPVAGETLKLTFTLPDGTSESTTLTATSSITPGPNEFTILGTPAATRVQLQAAINTALVNLAGSKLTAASAIAAGEDFFDIDDANPPQRVAGPPFDTAIAMVNGTAGNTVSWYTGEAGAASARSTATAHIDQSLSVSYGMRANEEALRTTVQSLAVFAATSYSSADPNAAASYDALKTRVTTALDGPPGQQTIGDIRSELAGAQTAMAAAKDRHQQTSTVLQEFLQKIEGTPQEEVAAQIMALQTSLQASLQTTALLLRTNLLEYL